MSSRNRKWATWALIAVMAVAECELATRCFWKFMYGVPFFKNEQVMCLYYPEAKLMLQKKIQQDPKALQVLVLGASVMTAQYGNIPRLLGSAITRGSGRPVQMYNISRSSLSSRDSLIKYKNLGDYRFDLVIFYHGINDTRANNVPEADFRDDYSHYGWYDAVNALDRHPEMKWISLPFMLEYLRISISAKLGLKKYMPSEWPDENWVRREGPVQTEGAFLKNLEEILMIAKRRGEKVFLMTFCHYKAAGYSREAFERGELDYAAIKRPQPFPIELWGDANFIPKALDVSNQVIRRLAAKHQALFLDMERVIPKKGDYFIDFCHFSSKGVVAFKDVAAIYLLKNWSALKS
jgi:hypothetical protein